MTFTTLVLPPSSSLPPLRSLCSLTDTELKSALQNLQKIYCPLRIPVPSASSSEKLITNADSGYASEDEEVGHGKADSATALSALRCDEFERAYVIRWLTTLISRADSLPLSEDSVTDIIDEAAFVLASFSDTGDGDQEDALYRDFCFPVELSTSPPQKVEVQLKDLPLSGIDHTDVGLQSWGGSIVFSSLLCAMPQRFGLVDLSSNVNILELGAGTGLISLTLMKLMPLLTQATPTLVATDYHAAVLDNLRANIAMSVASKHASCIPAEIAVLDWTAPPASRYASVRLLLAADAVYALEHAVWLRDCATQILARDGIFWLMATVRTSGKFEDIRQTVDIAFQETRPRSRSEPVLQILDRQVIDKRQGIGRGDESGYILYKIGWSSA